MSFAFANRDDLVFRLEGVDHNYWSDRLLFHHWRVLRLIGEDDWLNKQWPVDFLCRRVCIWSAKLDVSLDGLLLRYIDLWCVIDLGLG